MTQETTLNSADESDLGEAFGQFTTGVAVVTAQGADGNPYGATVTAFASVSLDPPLAQVALKRSSRAAKHLAGASFAINVLSADQLNAARYFAGEAADHEPEWDLIDGLPVLLGNTATLQCRQWNTYDGGDHIIVVGEVLSFSVKGGNPLLSHEGLFRGVGEQPQDSRRDRWFAGAKTFRPFVRLGH